MTEFKGVMGRDFRESTPWWPETASAPEGAPNVVYIVLDDVGYAQIGCYGSDIETPNIDRLAAGGLRYTNFHTTALCSPTRSCLLTGLNHHSNGMASIVELASGFPGYNARIPKSSAFLSEILVRQGYAAYAVGKWHLTPAEESHAAGPRGRWPLGRGFERFYGFMGGETNQWEPALVHDNHEVDPPQSFEDGYHLTEDLSTRAIEFIQDLRAAEPKKPFFLYFCPGACHAPHHAPREWIEKYRGRFDQGWDAWRDGIFARQQKEGIIPPGTELSPRPHWVQAWDALSADQQRLFSRMMEVYAGFLSHTDHHIGRLIDYIDALGELDNTIVVLISDNGASAEGGPNGSVNESLFFNGIPDPIEHAIEKIDDLGGPDTYNHYAWGWAWAGNTPLRRWKRETHEGGVTDPMIVHWPKGIAARGDVRRQYTHAIDVLPTVLEALGAERPPEIDGVTLKPVEGTSFAYTFTEPEAPARHQTQYYEMMGSRAIYHDGWKAVTFHPITGLGYDGSDWKKPFHEDTWELYHVGEDFSECNDLAQEHPEKLRELTERWWAEAGRFNVLPLDNRGINRAGPDGPGGRMRRKRYEYRPGGSSVPENIAVNVRDRSHHIVATCEIPEGGAEGVVLAHGSYFGGYSLFVQDGLLQYAYNFVGMNEYRIKSNVPVPAGRVTLGYEFTKTERFQGTGALYINGEKVGEGELPRTIPYRIALAGEGLCCGFDGGLPVTRDYKAPFRFTGTIDRVIVDVTGEPFRDAEAERRIAMAEQ